MTKPVFAYTTYIRTTPEKLWQALTTPEFTDQYWVPGIISDWKKGSRWEHKNDDGSVKIHGEVLESVPGKRLVLTWLGTAAPVEYSKVAFDIIPLEGAEGLVQLDVLHDGFSEGSVMAPRVADGWPRVLSNLKSLLETGKTLINWGQFKSCTPPKAA